MKRVGYGLFLLCAVFVGSSCGGSQSGVVTLPDPVIRFINASPNSTALDMSVNDTQIANNVPYLGSSATFASVLQADYDVSVQEDGNPETQAIEVAQLNRNQDYVAVATGLVTPPNTEFDKRLRCTPAPFNRTRPNGDKARLLVFNAYNRSFGNDTPTIDFQNPGDTPQFQIQDIPFGEGRELIVDATALTFVARRNGTEFEITPQNTFTFGGGKIYAAIVSGIEDETGAQAPKITYIELQSR